MVVHTGLILPIRISCFIFSMGVLKHMSLEGGAHFYANNYPSVIKYAYCYWPFVMIGLYTVIPRRFGNIYYDCFNLIWMVILSYIANRNLHPL
jgi:hypothetical protein